MFSEDLFNVFEEDEDKEKKPKKKLKRPGGLETTRQDDEPMEEGAITKKPKIDFAAFEGEEEEKDGEEKAEGVKEDET